MRFIRFFTVCGIIATGIYLSMLGGIIFNKPHHLDVFNSFAVLIAGPIWSMIFVFMSRIMVKNGETIDKTQEINNYLIKRNRIGQ